MDKIYTALGFMTGTSMDGIDLALIKTDGADYISRMGGIFQAYDISVRERIEEMVALVRQSSETDWPYLRGAEMPSDIAILQNDLVEAHAQLARKFLNQNGLEMADIELVGYHGQTLIHRPDIAFTYQLGCGASLSKKLGIPLVDDLRQNDLQHNGQGAPLVPIYHKALLNGLIREKKLSSGSYAFINIGGVSNVSFMNEAGDLLAFDTGPGNALLDDWIFLKTGEAFDKDGRLSLEGSADEEWCEHFLGHDYFSQTPPKSMDRNLFGSAVTSLTDRNLSPADGAASLVALTARSIAAAARYFSDEPRAWIIGGGGQKNPAIIQALQNEVSGKVITSDVLGFDGDLIEAECFAYLAVRSLKGLPISFPGTTGVSQPLSGGVLRRP